VKVTNEKTENRQAFLTFEMESAEVEEALEKAYHRLVQKTRIPGFRKGKAPRTVLERHIGKESLFEDALNNLIPETYEKAVEEQEIEAIARPQFEIVETEPLVFKAVVPLKPMVELGDYQSIQDAPEEVTVTEDDINAVIERIRHQHATWEPAERPVEFDDLVVLDVESSIEDKPFVNQNGAQYQVLHDLSFPAPGFAEQLTGMSKNEEKEFKLQFPEDYPSAELIGKEATFKVKVIEIKQEILPEITDDFAAEVSSDFKTMELLRERVSSDFKIRAEAKARVDFEERLLDAVVDLCQVEFPPILVETEIHRILNQRFQRGEAELEEYLGSVGKTEEELHEELHPVAAKRITRSLVLGKVVEDEKIEISDAEIDGEIENIKNSATENRDELEKILDAPQARESIERTLLTRKTVGRLVEIATGSIQNNETKTIEKEEEK